MFNTELVPDAIAALPTLQGYIPNLPQRDQSFARDLIDHHRRKQTLSPKQAPWVGKLIDRAVDAMQPTDPARAVPLPFKSPVTDPTAQAPELAKPLGDATAVRALFDRVRIHLKAPAVVIQVPDLGFVRVYVGRTGARYAGKMVVCDEYGQKPYPWVAQTYGIIRDDGMFEPRKSVKTPDVLLTTLADFAADPIKYAKAYGKLTGKCCFCRNGLEDERSTSQGYGPVCAEHYGLPWGDRPTADSVFLAADQVTDQGTMDLSGLLQPGQPSTDAPVWRVTWNEANGTPSEFKGSEQEARDVFARIVGDAVQGNAADVLLWDAADNCVDSWGT